MSAAVRRQKEKYMMEFPAQLPDDFEEDLPRQQQNNAKISDSADEERDCNKQHAGFLSRLNFDASEKWEYSWNEGMERAIEDTIDRSCGLIGESGKRETTKRSEEREDLVSSAD